MSKCGEGECVFTVYVFVFLVHVCISQSARSVCECVCLHMYVYVSGMYLLLCLCVSVLLFEWSTSSLVCMRVCVFVFSQCKPVAGKLLVEGEVNEWWCYLFGLADCTFSSEKSAVSLIPSCPPRPGTE